MVENTDTDTDPSVEPVEQDKYSAEITPEDFEDVEIEGAASTSESVFTEQ